LTSGDTIFTREELLGGLPARQASLLLFAIESRTAQLISQNRRATEPYLTPQAAQEREHLFLEAIAAARQLPLKPSIQDLEFYAPHWASLVPEDAAIQATIARMIGEKYSFTKLAVPAIRAALALDSAAVKEAYQRLNHGSLETIYAAHNHRRSPALGLGGFIQTNRTASFWTAFLTPGSRAAGVPIVLAARRQRLYSWWILASSIW
jgi:hypothetical protein